jgi:hypothetical protein
MNRSRILPELAIVRPRPRVKKGISAAETGVTRAPAAARDTVHPLV